MHSYGYILDANGTSPGVQRLYAPQSTDAAARQATQEQQFGDEFKPQENPDVESLIAELNRLETECSNLCMQLYGPPNQYMTGKPYEGPPYLERERIHRRLNECEDRCAGIKAQLREIVDAGGLHNEIGGPYTGNARVIG